MLNLNEEALGGVLEVPILLPGDPLCQITSNPSVSINQSPGWMDDDEIYLLQPKACLAFKFILFHSGGFYLCVLQIRPL